MSRENRLPVGMGVGGRWVVEGWLFFSSLESILFQTPGVQEQAPHLKKHGNSNPQDLIVYTDGAVTEDKSRQGFTVKQGKTTGHKDSQATHAIILSDFMSLLQKVKNGMGSPDWHVSVFDIHLQKLLGMYCPGHTKQPPQLACISDDLKC